MTRKQRIQRLLESVPPDVGRLPPDGVELDHEEIETRQQVLSDNLGVGDTKLMAGDISHATPTRKPVESLACAREALERSSMKGQIGWSIAENPDRPSLHRLLFAPRAGVVPLIVWPGNAKNGPYAATDARITQLSSRFVTRT